MELERRLARAPLLSSHHPPLFCVSPPPPHARRSEPRFSGCRAGRPTQEAAATDALPAGAAAPPAGHPSQQPHSLRTGELGLWKVFDLCCLLPLCHRSVGLFLLWRGFKLNRQTVSCWRTCIMHDSLPRAGTSMSKKCITLKKSYFCIYI